MNTTEILAAFDEAGITADEVVTSLAAHERVVAEYSVRCSQTVLITATVDSKRKSKADLARETGASAMQVGRYYAAGLILIAHPSLDAEEVMAYANTHSQDECKAVAKMDEKDARREITPTKGRSTPKTLSEKVLKNHEDFLKLLALIVEAEDWALLDATDSAHAGPMMQAIADAYAVRDAVPVEEVA